LQIYLNLTVPILGFSWPRSPTVAEAAGLESFQPVHLHQRSKSNNNDNEDEGADVLHTMLRSSYRPQLAAPGDGTCYSKVGHKAEEIRTSLDSNSEGEPRDAVVVRLFPTGGGVATVHLDFEHSDPQRIRKTLSTLFDSKEGGDKIREAIRKDINAFLPGEDTLKFDSGDVYKKIPGALPTQELPIYPSLVISGIDVEDWTTKKLFESNGHSGEEEVQGENEPSMEEWTPLRLLQLAARVVIVGENDERAVNARNVFYHFFRGIRIEKGREFLVDTLNFSLDRRIGLFVGRRGAAFVCRRVGQRSDVNGADGGGQLGDHIIGGAINLVEIMWNRLYTLVWLNNELDDLVEKLRFSDRGESSNVGEQYPREENGEKELNEIYIALFNCRRSLFALLKDPACFLFDGGSVSDIADFLLDRFWIKRQESLIESKLELLDELLASWQVLLARNVVKEEGQQKG